jgi:hypothetical protein
MAWRAAADFEIYCLSTGPDGGSESELSGYTAVENISTLVPTFPNSDIYAVMRSVQPSTTRTFGRRDLSDQTNFQAQPGNGPFGGAPLLIASWHDMGENNVYPKLRIYVREEYASITERGTRDVCNWAVNTKNMSKEERNAGNWNTAFPPDYEGYRFAIRWRVRKVIPFPDDF